MSDFNRHFRLWFVNFCHIHICMIVLLYWLLCYCIAYCVTVLLILETVIRFVLSYILSKCEFLHIQGDQNISVHVMITIQKVTSNVQSVPRQSPDIIDSPNCVLEDRVQYSMSTFQLYSVMVIFKLSIMWGLFKYAEYTVFTHVICTPAYVAHPNF
jgi:hypothetical protein